MRDREVVDGGGSRGELATKDDCSLPGGALKAKCCSWL